MFLLELMLLFLLQLQGISGETIHRYNRPGEEAVLPCGTDASFVPICSTISWFYYRDQDQSVTQVERGKVVSSARADRLSLDGECSLVINDITAEDVGLYVCLRGGNTRFDVFLNILTISPSQPERDGEVGLQCSLLTFSGLEACQGINFLWRDETGTVLVGEDAGNCVSAVTVKHQSDDNRKYTCQLVKNNQGLIEAEYKPELTVPPPAPTPDPPSNQTYVIIGAVAGVLAVLVIIAAVFIKYRKRAGATEGVQKSTQQADEPESNLTYVTVNHANHQASPYRKVKEEVTYSAVKHSGADRSRR